MRNSGLNIVCILLCLLSFSAFPLFSQTDTLTILSNPEYFIAGADDHNLIEAISRNDIPATTFLINRGVSPNTLSPTGNSALMYATETGNIDLMRLLIEAGADVNTKGYKMETALFISIFKNDFQAAKFLLENGTDPNVKDSYGVTPLIYAAATNQYQSADLLLFYNADETVTDENRNDPLLTAVTFENLETTDVLLQNGLNPDSQDKEGNTPLIVATQRGRYDMMDLLLDYKANPNISNKKGYTPLAYAIIYNDYRATKMLIERDADVNYQIGKSRNMADLAIVAGKDSINNLLKEKGAKVSSKPDFSEFRFTYGNSFNNTDYFMHVRGGMVDPKYGFFFETGLDFRPFKVKVQTEIDETIYLFRESRIGWSQAIGKYFRFYNKNGNEISMYAAVNGMLGFPDYNGSSYEDPVVYSVYPSAGFSITGNIIGLKAGVDWYNFRNQIDKYLKYNLSLIIRISYPRIQFDRKEIYWD